MNVFDCVSIELVHIVLNVLDCDFMHTKCVCMRFEFENLPWTY